MNEHGGVVPIEELIKISKEPGKPEESRAIQNDKDLSDEDEEIVIKTRSTKVIV